MPKKLRRVLCITLLSLCHPQLAVRALASELPAPAARIRAEIIQSAAANSPQNPPAQTTPPELPDAPDAAQDRPVSPPDQIPVAEPVPAPPAGTPVRIEAQQQQKSGNTYTLTGEVTIHYRKYTLRADKASYNGDTGEVRAEGHLQLEGGPDDEFIQADHGTVNLDLDTARFYQVIGTIGVRMNGARRKVVYTGINPFIFTGRVVIKSGPDRYKVIGGSMTSCRLPRPDWRISASQIAMSNGQASARNGLFHLLGLPILYLPYVTHPVMGPGRQSGFLIPVYSNSNTKGTVIGEQIYLVLGRSADLTIGTDYYSLRGWAPSGEFRYRGRDEDFADLRFTALFDRGIVTGTTRQNQGGQDVLLNGRHSFGAYTRAVARAEYLSSFVYREAFAESFAQAVASQVNSTAFVTHNRGGFSESVNFNRYTSYQSVTPGNDIVIAHLPSLEMDATDHRLGDTPFVWSVDGSFAGLDRHEPLFETAQEVGRFDLNPRIAAPMHWSGWKLRPEFGVRDTLYSKSQLPAPEGSESLVPTYDTAGINRKDIEATIDLRPPVLERDFRPRWLQGKDERALRHTLEPALTYHYVSGIDNFPSILRFDPIDIASDTNELEYSLTQRLYLRRALHASCGNAELPPPVTGRIYLPLSYRECGGNTGAWMSWQVAQKHFFDPQFGGAVAPFRRNVIASALDFTGISFLSSPREYSPVISRLTIHTDRQVEVGWDLDYDPKAGRITGSNVFADVRHDNYFGSVSHARLDALKATFNADTASQVTNYNQIRLLAGYGYGTKPGFSAGLNAGYDFNRNELQYGGVQTSYNWECCGLTLQYRRLALGSVRNENYESFNFTLAGIGTAGNINRSQLIY